MIALVTGGRKFWPTDESERVLDVTLRGVVLVIEGEADGFDSWVRDRARSRRITVQPVPALWGVARALGLTVAREGPRRNARMIRWANELAAEFDLGTVLIAGPGGRGTADMRHRCHGYAVREVPGRLAE